MAVYIKNFEIPYSCDDCILKTYNVFGVACCIFHMSIVDGLILSRHDECPLIEEEIE